MKTERLPKWAETELPHGFLLYIPGNLRKEAPAPAEAYLVLNNVPSVVPDT